MGSRQECITTANDRLTKADFPMTHSLIPG